MGKCLVLGYELRDLSESYLFFKKKLPNFGPKLNVLNYFDIISASNIL